MAEKAPIQAGDEITVATWRGCVVGTVTLVYSGVGTPTVTWKLDAGPAGIERLDTEGILWIRGRADPEAQQALLAARALVWSA